MPSKKWIPVEQEKALDRLDEIASRYSRGMKWVFDWDGTLMRGDVGNQTAWALLRSGLVDPERIPSEWSVKTLRDMNHADFQKMRHSLAQKIGFQEIFEMETTLMAGIPQDVAQKLVSATLDMAIKMGDLRRLEPMGELLRKNAHQALVVSGSPKICVATVAKHYGVREENVYGTELNLVDGIYQGEYGPFGVVWAEQKKVVLEMEGYNEVFFVAGDSTGDWDMMQLASGVVWCVLWPRKENPWATLREQLEMYLDEVFLPLPTKAGIYWTENLPGRAGPRYWIVEIHEAHT
jgi:phosphoserine phosphatase